MIIKLCFLIQFKKKNCSYISVYLRANIHNSFDTRAIRPKPYLCVFKLDVVDSDTVVTTLIVNNSAILVHLTLVQTYTAYLKGVKQF